MNDDLKMGDPRSAGDLIAERDRLRKELAAEREVGHNQAVTLGQHIARLEDQLAAERHPCKNGEIALQLKQQLADERENRQAVEKLMIETANAVEKRIADATVSERDWSEHLRIQLAAEVEKVNKLQEQLAAEREIHEAAVRTSKHAINELHKQLADERAKVQTLVDALKRCVSRLTPCHEEGAVYKQAIDALKKYQKVTRNSPL